MEMNQIILFYHKVLIEQQKKHLLNVCAFVFPFAWAVYRKMYKLALSCSSTCPNRDGTKAFGGCIFCSQNGSGDFVPNKIFSSGTVHDIEGLSIMVPDSLDIDRVGSDRIFERGFDLTYPVKIKLKNKYKHFLLLFDSIQQRNNTNKQSEIIK